MFSRRGRRRPSQYFQELFIPPRIVIEPPSDEVACAYFRLRGSRLGIIQNSFSTSDFRFSLLFSKYCGFFFNFQFLSSLRVIWVLVQKITRHLNHHYHRHVNWFKNAMQQSRMPATISKLLWINWMTVIATMRGKSHNFSKLDRWSLCSFSTNSSWGFSFTEISSTSKKCLNSCSELNHYIWEFGINTLFFL